MTLYDITGDWLQLQTMLEQAEPDEDLQVYLDTIESIEGDLDEKIAGCVAVYKNLMADADALKAEADKLRNRADTMNRKATSLKEYIMRCMQAVGKRKGGDAVNCASIVKNGGKKPVVFTDEVPQEWQKVRYEPDNTAIREALENGEELPFAELGERGEHINIK